MTVTIRLKQKFTALIVLTTLAFLPVVQAEACAPVYPLAVIVNWNHPDLPLKSFAAGNLGIVQSTWARSYLSVAYRYLTACNLTASEQASVLRLWHTRLKNAASFTSEADQVSVMEAYLKLRSRALGVSDKSVPNIYSKTSAYSYEQNIEDDAFANARATLQARMKRYGPNSREVRQWINGQDDVFGLNKSGKLKIPPALGKGFDQTLVEDRAYQIAAATLYLKDYARAGELFAKIAQDKCAPGYGLASYLVARCKAKDVLENGRADDAPATIALIESMAAKEPDLERRLDLVDLIGPLNFLCNSDRQSFERLVQSVSHQHSDGFGRDVGDLTFKICELIGQAENKDKSQADTGLTGSEKAKSDAGLTGLTVHDLQIYDLTDWLVTLCQPYDDWYDGDKEKKQIKAKRAIHALQQWRKNHTLHWLVAVMCCNGLRSAQLKDALEAAKKIPVASPAYLTASFYIIDELIASNQKGEARKRLKTILAHSRDLPRSAGNLFKAQLLAVSTSADEYLDAACLHLPEEAENDLMLPSNWLELERRSSAGPEISAWDKSVADDLNYQLPLSVWLKLCRKRDISPELHGQIICATWLRSILLNKQELAKELSGSLVEAYPSCAQKVSEYNSAPAGEEKQYALARLVLENYGMSPYVCAGVPRIGNSINQFDWYQINFWLPLAPSASRDADGDATGGRFRWAPVVEATAIPTADIMEGYCQAGIGRLLSPKEKTDAAKELNQIRNNHPSKLFGQAVLDWARSHPQDPDLPLLLFKIVKLPWWSGSSETGSLYSKKAFKLLHASYPHNKWTAKALWWY
jgi:hypothetical protein